jgi:hypothetical protein
VDGPPARLEAQAVAPAARHEDAAGRTALAGGGVEEGQKAPAVLEEDDGLPSELEGRGLVALGADGGFDRGEVVKHVEGVVEEAHPFLERQDTGDRGVEPRLRDGADLDLFVVVGLGGLGWLYGWYVCILYA